jgi:PHD/YefM family antitoxin component YafN of YafNO toxin-antitoxin module
VRKDLGEIIVEIYTTTQARTNLFKLIDYTNVSHEPVHIVGKHNKAVLIAEDDYRAMVETLFLISIPGMKDSIIKASKEPLDTFEEAIDWDNV